MIIKGKHLKVIPENNSFFKLSVSKTKTFQTCKKKYLFNYIKKLPTQERDYHVFGKFLHLVLELFYKDIINKYVGPDNVLMKKSFNAALLSAMDKDPKQFKDKLTPEQKKECFEILKLYLIKRQNDRQKNIVPTVIAVEKPFNIDIDGKVLLNGFIDLVKIDSDGVLHVADYKTSKSSKYLKKDFTQLKTYAYVMCLEDPNLELVRCSYVMLRLNFEEVTKEYKRKEIMLMENEIESNSELIQSEKLFRASPGPLCNYCDYLHLCSEAKEKLKIIDPNFGEINW